MAPEALDAIEMMAKVLTGNLNTPFADLYPTEPAIIKAFSQNREDDFCMIPKLAQQLPKSDLKDGWDSEEMSSRNAGLGTTQSE